jgi:hypothetical protein
VVVPIPSSSSKVYVVGRNVEYNVAVASDYDYQNIFHIEYDTDT